VARTVSRRASTGFGILHYVNPAYALIAALAPMILGLLGSPALGAQTRDQCEACCKNAGYDEYYAEQCRLKCFRHPDHCSAASSHREPPPVATPRPTEEPAPPPPPRQSKFVWPNPLSLVPGKEWEAAAQILALNGIPQQHPNYQAALRNVQGVLMDFVRKNPTGGRLPTSQLERVLRPLR
jgi:hypothetical protein